MTHDLNMKIELGFFLSVFKMRADCYFWNITVVIDTLEKQLLLKMTNNGPYL